MPAAVMMYDSTQSADMRHVIPHSVHDPFFYLEINGAPHTVIKSLEVARMREVPGMTVHPFEEYGYDHFRAEGQSDDEALISTLASACRALGVSSGVTPPRFPLDVADGLRARGVQLAVNRKIFSDRRRVKSGYEVAGIRRAQLAAEAGVAHVADQLCTAEIASDGGLYHAGIPLTCELLKIGIQQAFLDHGCDGGDLIVAHGPQTCIGHHAGSGQIRAGEPVTVDICPRDLQSACYSDMTRTFVMGPISVELATYHRVVSESINRVFAAIRPGISVAELHRISCEPIAAAGFPTQLEKHPGMVLNEGFFHSLGHGIGLEIHEPPALSQNDAVLVEGDVIAVEPGCYRQGYGGVRLEDIVLVTSDGAEVVTQFPYDLSPSPAHRQ